MDDRATEVTPDAQPTPDDAHGEGPADPADAAADRPVLDGADAARDTESEAHPDLPAEAADEEPHGEGDGPAGETRAQRRARRDSLLHEPVLPALATVPRPVSVGATVVLAALLGLAVLADPVVLAAGLAWAGIVLAWGWPTLHGSSSRFGSSLAIGVTAVLAPAAAALAPDEPYLRFVPVTVVIGLAVMFVHQMVRRDGRPRLTDSIAVTSFALAAVTVGTAWVPLTRSERAADLAVVAFAAIAASALADLVAGLDRVRPWMLPLAMLLGGLAGLGAAAALGGPDTGPAALTGFLVAAVAHAMRRTLSALPAVGSFRAQLAAAASSLLVPGVVVYVLSLALVG
ncbi:hypothetical protein [Oryzobacter telluris]|uniref:hypothetical protein n=1 Tax=Oryzobacter telluris TaxID=3149179 RepID=UPI00370D932A